MKILLGSIYPYIFALLIFIIPFDNFVRAWPNILLMILAVSFPFVIKKRDLKKIDKRLFLLVIGFFLFLLINTLITGRWSNNHLVVEKVGIAIGLVVLYLPISKTKKIDNAIIFSSLAAVIYSVFNIMMLIKDVGEFNFSNNATTINTLLIDRLYLGLLSIYSIIISYKSISKHYNKLNRYYLINIIINVAFLFIIVARMAIISLVLIAILWFFYNTIKKKVILISGSVIVILLVLTFALNDNMAKRFFYETEYNSDHTLVQKAFDWEPRTVIWACGVEIVQQGENIWSGLGFKSSRSALVDCYAQADINEGRRDWFLKKKYNSHNQFLDFYLSTGVVALLLFFVLFGFLFIKSRSNFFEISLVLSLFLFVTIENIFHRQIGAYYFGVVLIYLLMSHVSSQPSLDND